MNYIYNPLGELIYPARTTNYYDNNMANIYFSVDPNKKVYAILEGEITSIKKDENYGNVIILKTTKLNWSGQFNSPLYIAYCHLNSVSVSKGDTVNMGDEIGTTGKTGNKAFLPGLLTLFFTTGATTLQTKSIDISNLTANTDAEVIDLDAFKNGRYETIKAQALKEYIHKIFSQKVKTVELYSGNDMFSAFAGDDADFALAIIAQERNFSMAKDSNDSDFILRQAACVEAVARCMRNRAYKDNLTWARAGQTFVPESDYSTAVSNYSVHFDYQINLDGTNVTFKDFCTRVLSGQDYNLIEKVCSADRNELYAITGFWAGYREDAIGHWSDGDNNEFYVAGWNVFPANPIHIVNPDPPTRK